MATSASFKGLSFYIPIGSSLKKTAKQLQALVVSHGGNLSASFGDQVTHALVSDSEMASNSSMIEKALKKGVAVITEAWLQHTIKNGGAPVNAPNGTIIRPAATGNNKAQSTALVRANAHQVPIPVLSLMLPHTGPITGNFKVAVFGQRFVPGPGFRIRIGHLDAVDYEFHSETAVVATIPATTAPFAPGETLTGVSNDGGANWCQPLVFSVYDPVTSAAPLPPPAMLTQHALSSLMAAASQSSGGNLLLDSSSSLPNGAPSKDTSASSADVLRPKQLLKALDREVRIFISSPFTDMQKERDTLVRSAIPKLRRLCMQRDVAFSYVDLRWGVTAQQSESAVSLLLCLREIESCNLFVGFYGERYGWCVSPERDQTQNELLRRSIASAAKEYPWVSEMANLSMSEIEMRMVVDRKYQHGDKQSWFYLRDPYFIEEVPEKERHLYRSESDRAHTQLESFKRHLTVHARPTNYSRPDDVSDLVFADIKSYIDREYPAEARLSPLERERFRHNVYSRSFTHCYLANEFYFNALDRHVSNVLPMPLVITGPSGIGKSALLSNWVLRHNDHAPEDIVIHHWVGCSPHSSNAGQVLSRILLELRKKLDFQDDKILPRDAKSGESAASGAASESGLGLDVKKVIKEFLNSLKTITSRYNHSKRRIVLVIDGLDKIDARENAQDLIWLPHTFPKSVRVILSCSPCFVLDVLKKRKGIEFLEINPMAEADRKAFIRLYLTHRSKRLTEKQEFQIAQAPQTSHPLYLKTLLDDLSEFGKFEQLDQKINSSLQASNASALYDIVLRRLEDEHDRKASASKPTLAASAMPAKPAVPVTNAFLSLLWGARRGLLLNSELDQLLTLKRGISEDVWMDFFVVADETLLADCSGLLLFANEDVRKAVETRYLKNEAAKIEVHKELAAFFEAIPDLTERKVEELPHQLAESKQWDKLRTCLRDLSMFDRLYTSDAHKFDLLRYWRLLESQGPEYDIVENYKTVISRGLFPAGLIVGDLIYHLGRFMLEMDKNAGAEFMFQKAEAYYHQASQMLNVAKVSAALGELYFTQMRHEDCERMLKKSISIFEKEKGTQSQSLVHPLDRLGVLYTAQHKHDLALASLERALQISESNAGADTVESANVIYDLACTYLSIGENLEIAKAEQYLLRALAIKESALGPWDVEVSHVLLRLGAMYLEHDQFADAEECLSRSLLIRETKLGRDHSRVAQCLRHLITCYEMQEQYGKAIEVGERALAITKRVYGETNFHTSGVLLRIGTVVLTEGKPGSTQRAKKYVTDAMEMRKKLYPATHRCVVECQKILDSMNPTPVSTPSGYPPPPPFPFGVPPPQQMAKPSGPVKQLVYDASGIPVGPAPPPPPPKAGGQAPAVRAAVIEQGPSNVGYLEQLQNFSQTVSLNRNEDTRDRSDASKQAKNMLGAGERRIQFKKKAKWA
jgi:preprotein translocase subunit SecA/nephrocystin-3